MSEIDIYNLLIKTDFESGFFNGNFAKRKRRHSCDVGFFSWVAFVCVGRSFKRDGELSSFLGCTTNIYLAQDWLESKLFLPS